MKALYLKAMSSRWIDVAIVALIWALVILWR
jgi:hypothetical protein